MVAVDENDVHWYLGSLSLSQLCLIGIGQGPLSCTCPAWLNLLRFPATLFVSLAKEGVPAVEVGTWYRTCISWRPPNLHFNKSKNISSLARIRSFSPHHLRSHCQPAPVIIVVVVVSGGRLLRTIPAGRVTLTYCTTLPPGGERGGLHQRETTPPPHPSPPSVIIGFLLVARQTRHAQAADFEKQELGLLACFRRRKRERKRERERKRGACCA